MSLRFYAKSKFCVCFEVHIPVNELSVRTLQSMRDDNSFDLFWAAVLSKSQRLQIALPKLPRDRKVLAELKIGSSASEQVDCVKDLFRRQYFEAVDLVINCIRVRFDPRGGGGGGGTS